jgi:DNA recombination protein RmuC
METSLLFGICVLILIAIALIIVLKPKSNADFAAMQSRLAELQTQLGKIETNLKDDFKTNREENSNIARENRLELNNTLKDFKAEQALTLKNITDQSQNSLKEINKTLAEKVDVLVERMDANYKANRDSLSENLREFVAEQKKKFDELKLEQKDLTKNTGEQLEKITIKVEEKLNGLTEQNKTDTKASRDSLSENMKEFVAEQKKKFDELKLEQKDLTKNTIEQLGLITTKVEEKLTGLTEQDKTDNAQMREALVKAFRDFQDTFDKNVKSFNELQREKFGQLEEKQNKLIEGTEKKLEQMRETVDEKLQKTLNERLGQSFETVGKQLEAVQLGLGEMKSLAQDVGGLKKVLSNVKQRGGVGEIQLEMLLEQILAPDQYEANVRTKLGSSDLVEFAIKLPGRDDAQRNVYLPVDAKFPKDAYEQLVDAYDIADPAAIDLANKNIENVIKKMAKDIRDKYLDPPNTTDFAIMFLPFEGIYAEVIRRSNLLEQLQREFKIVVTGPTTLAAILNSLQMGFRTLALQKRSSEVWSILGAVKTEFEKFGSLLDKAHKHISSAGETIEQLQGTRTKAINRRLKEVQALPASESAAIISDIALGETIDDEQEN